MDRRSKLKKQIFRNKKGYDGIGYKKSKVEINLVFFHGINGFGIRIYSLLLYFTFFLKWKCNHGFI